MVIGYDRLTDKEDAHQWSSDQQAAVSSPAVETTFVPRPWLLALILVVVTFVAYQPTWHAGFIWDDDAHLTANTALTAHHGLKLIWSSLAVARYYPLTLTTYWIERRLWGLHPLPYHLVNVLLHAANGVAGLFPPPPPANPRALGARHGLGAPPGQRAIRGVDLRDEEPPIRPVLLPDTAVLPEIRRAKASQPSLVPRLPVDVLVCTCIRVRLGGHRQSGIDRHAAPGVVAGRVVAARPLGTCRRRADRSIHRDDLARLGIGASRPVSHALKTGPTAARLGVADRLVIAGRVVWFYAASVLWPFRLAFVYPRWTIHASSVWAWVPLAALVVLGVALWQCRRRAWCRAVLFAVAYFVVALLPALGLFQLSYFQYSFVADRFQYLASLGIILLAGPAVAAVCQRTSFWRRHDAAAVAVASLLAVLATLTWSQARIYNNSETLWQKTIDRNPRCRPTNGLGYLLMEQGQTNNAIAHYELALQNKPDYVEAHCNLGYIFLQQGDFNGAINHYGQALRIMPNLHQVHYNLAVAMTFAGHVDDAIDHYQQAVRIYPDYAEAHWNLGQLLAEQGKLTNAIDHFERAVEVKPSLPEMHYSLAAALSRAGPPGRGHHQRRAGPASQTRLRRGAGQSGIRLPAARPDRRRHRPL